MRLPLTSLLLLAFCLLIPPLLPAQRTISLDDHPEMTPSDIEGPTNQTQVLNQDGLWMDLHGNLVRKEGGSDGESDVRTLQYDDRALTLSNMPIMRVRGNGTVYAFDDCAPGRHSIQREAFRVERAPIAVAEGTHEHEEDCDFVEDEPVASLGLSDSDLNYVQEQYPDRIINGRLSTISRDQICRVCLKQERSITYHGYFQVLSEYEQLVLQRAKLDASKATPIADQERPKLCVPIPVSLDTRPSTTLLSSIEPATLLTTNK